MISFKHKLESIFPTFLWTLKASGVNNEALKKYCLKMREETEGVVISNKGGWHSGKIPYVPDELVDLMNDITAYVNLEGSQYTDISDLKIGNFWININRPGDYNLTHDHQNSILSCVYYVDVPEDNTGDLVLERHDHSEFFLSQYRNLYPFSSLHVVKKPETGIAYIFPAWIRHRVGQNLSNSERISIAFNIVPK